jgi:hypothetical protein
MSNRVIDPNFIPFATAERPPGLYDIRKMGEGIVKAWKEGTVSNIEWVVQRLVETAEMNDCTNGVNRLGCREQINLRNVLLRSMGVTTPTEVDFSKDPKRIAEDKQGNTSAEVAAGSETPDTFGG